MARAGEQWWETQRYALALVLLSAVPLLWPAVPPLTDLPGHMGRYAIQLGLERSPHLGQWYSFKWGLIGNLGVDLLVEPLGRLLGIERAVKLIVIAIPMLTVAGLLWIAREVHGRLPPSAAFALPLAYGFPFQFGFVNFALSMALAFVAFAFWLRLGRQERFRLRAALFVPIGIAIWITHIFGWGVLGLLAFVAEVTRQRGRGWIAAVWHGGLACLPLAPPLLLMAIWRSDDVAGETADWFRWKLKRLWLLAILRERWELFDKGSAWLLLAVTLAGIVWLGIRRWLMVAAALLLAVYLLLPRILLGSAYADMRLAAYMAAIAVIAVSVARRSPRVQQAVALAALAFFLARTAATTVDFHDRDRLYRAQLGALAHIPRGARVFALVNLPCEGRWAPSKLDHLASLALVRRHAFVNGQWQMPGAQLLRVDYEKVIGRFASDPSQIVRPERCRPFSLLRRDQSLARFPRDGFDYVWLINTPRAEWPERDPGLTRVWSIAGGALYRIGSATSASEIPNGSLPRATQ